MKNKNKNNTQNNNQNEIMKIILSSFVGAILALGASVIFNIYQTNSEIEKSATLLYHDILHSKNGLDIAQTYLDDKSVMHTPHSNLVNNNNFRELIIDLRNKIENKHLSKLLTYYGNIEQLENARSMYWSSDVPEEQNQNLEYYRNLLTLIYEQPQQEYFDAFEEVKRLSSFKEDI